MTDDGRDYLAEMDAHITRMTEGSGWVAAVVADKLYNHLVETDTDLLDGWLDVMAKDTLRRAIAGRENARKTRERHAASSGRFSDAARNFEQGKDAGGRQLLGMFSLMHVVSEEGVRKRAGEMTGADHLFVTSAYEESGRKALMRAAFHRAVAEKVGDRRTDEVYSLEQYEAMYRDITGSREENQEGSK